MIQKTSDIEEKSVTAPAGPECKDMVNSVIAHTYDLETPLVITPLRHALATGDELGDRFDITVTQKGQPVDLTGAGVTGYFIRTADGATVIVTGSASGNVASVTLPESCYAVPGRFTLTVKVSKGDVRHAVYVGEGAVLRSSTDTIIDPGHTIPDLDELLAKITELESATAAANGVVSKANNAATAAETAAGKANTAATAANTAKTNADAATKAANDAAGAANTAKSNADKATTAANNAASAANTAKTSADTAAANANAKADYIGNATFTAHNVDPGGTATVTKTDKDGHAHFDFGLVKGDPGNIAGNAPSADKLLHARQINRVDFDGTKDITVPRIVAQEIPDNNNVDLNTLLVWELNNLTNQNTIEYYTARSGAASNNVQNKPVDTDEGFSLTVRTLRYLGTDVAVMQEYASAKYKCVYRRFYRQNNHEGWTDWERIATTADIDGKFVSSVWGVLPDDKGDVRPKVGGRNYILDSATPYIFSLPSSGQRTANMARCSSMEVRDSLYGKTITFTADYDSNITAGRVVLAVTNSYQEVFAFNSVAKGSITKTITLKVPSTYNNQSPYILYLQANTATGATGSVTLSNMKLELGEVPTDWSTAPEDKIEELGGTNYLLGTNSGAENWRLNIDPSSGASGTVTGKTYYGTNGVCITRNSEDTTSYMTFVYDNLAYAKLKPDTDYVFSAMVRCSKPSNEFSFQISKTNSTAIVGVVDRAQYTTLPVEVFKKLVFKIHTSSTVTADATTCCMLINTNLDNNLADAVIDIYNPKLEEGSVPTDWSPASEDVVQTGQLTSLVEGILRNHGLIN